MSTSACVVLFLLFYVQCEANVISKLDFRIGQFFKHHTDKFYEHQKGSSHVVVRRGADFKFRTIFKHAHSDVVIDVQLTFATQWDKMIINVTSKSRDGWNLTQSKSANMNGIDFDLHIPGNASVGIWKMQLFVKMNNGSIIEQFDVPNKIIVLFNAWSKEDPAYFEEQYKLGEYVLAESGHLYFYEWHSYRYMKWIFGQFQEEILDSIMFILNQSWLSPRDRGDIVKVTRTLTFLLNYGKNYHGVLVGRWKPPYDKTLFDQPATHPLQWTGSAAILRQYYKTNGTPVGFGQCWVYAGILTTVYRALGIASRPVANFLSAHDNRHDLTLDTYYDTEGNINYSVSDTLWNFHEWVQAYYRRDDLGLNKGEWQNLDATPQAYNDGYLQVGPASSSLINSSQLGYKYETEYLYSEVNADQVIWSPNNQILRIDRNRVGLAVVTKAFKSDETENITHLFKPKENTQAERDSYEAAAKSLGIIPVSLRKEIHPRSQRDKMLSLSITPLKEVNVGSQINVEVLLRSKYSQNKEVTVTVKASSIYYHGEVYALIKNDTRIITLPASQQEKALFTIQSKDYIELLTNLRTIVIEAVVQLENQIYSIAERISLKTSKLLILAPKAVNYNTVFKVIVKFKNPLNNTLRNVRITVEGNGIKRKVVKLFDLNAFETENVALKLSSKYYGLETIVISLHSDILKEIVGHVEVQVKGRKRHVFAMYTKSNGSLEAENKDFDSDSEQNQNLVTADEFTCCSLVDF